MYRSENIRLTPQEAKALEKRAIKVKCLYNATLFRLRNWFTGRKKEKPTPNELEVAGEVNAYLEHRKSIGKKAGDPGAILGATFMENMLSFTGDPDYGDDLLYSQTAQGIVEQAVMDFRNWMKALKEYKRCPKKFSGKPKMPGYKKNAYNVEYPLKNQCVQVEEREDGLFIRIPHLGMEHKIRGFGGRLKSASANRKYGEWVLHLTFEVPDAGITEGAPAPGKRVAALDLGVNNLAAMANNIGEECLLFPGGAVKARNQWYNKQMAKIRHGLTVGHDDVKARPTKISCRLSRKREAFMKDAMHKAARKVIQWCVDHQVDTLVIGKTGWWKHESNIGHVNNQNFCSIPHNTLIFFLTYLGRENGIQVVEQEESSTSQMDFLSGDTAGAPYSGKRVKRGLYRSGTGICLNADVNAAANILKKAFPDAFEDVVDFRYLCRVRAVQYL